MQAAQQILQSLSICSLHAAGHQLPGLRTHHEHIFPGTCRTDSNLLADVDARVAQEIPRRRRTEARGNGLRGERAPANQSTQTSASVFPAHLRSQRFPVIRRRKALQTTSCAADTIVAEFKNRSSTSTSRATTARARRARNWSKRGRWTKPGSAPCERARLSSRAERSAKMNGALAPEV